MVRTKADGAMRVAAGGKAPKKTASRPVSMPSPNEKGGKDNLPGNRACPRETPTWQKKITFFYDKNAGSSKSTEDSGKAADDSLSQSAAGNNVEMEEGNLNIVESTEVDEFESMETDD